MNNMTKRRAKKIALREWELVKAAVDKDIIDNINNNKGELV